MDENTKQRIIAEYKLSIDMAFETMKVVEDGYNTSAIAAAATWWARAEAVRDIARILGMSPDDFPEP